MTSDSVVKGHYLQNFSGQDSQRDIEEVVRRGLSGGQSLVKKNLKLDNV